MQTNGKQYKDKILRIAILGIANSGKTTLFNGLTNANARVGNWHGVTTQVVAGKCFLQKNLQVEFLDLPGTYLEDDYTLEGKIALKELKRCNAILMVTEGVNTLKSVKLLSKLKWLNIPFMLVINMNSELERRGGFVDENKMYSRSGLSVIKAECNRKKEVLKIKAFIANVLKNNIYSLRVDTHEKNLAMQKALNKVGFIKCGVIYLARNDEGTNKRIAFEKVIK